VDTLAAVGRDVNMAETAAVARMARALDARRDAIQGMQQTVKGDSPSVVIS
jgi:hypothetical protein